MSNKTWKEKKVGLLSLKNEIADTLSLTNYWQTTNKLIFLIKFSKKIF